MERGDAWALAVALLAPLAVGLLVHCTVEPPARAWHYTLRKSPMRPPAAAFPLVWTYAYLAMGYASYLVWKDVRVAYREQGIDSAFAALWSLELVLHYIHVLLLQLWQTVTMGAHFLGGGLLVMLLLDIYVPALIALWSPLVPTAGYLLLPYLGWLLVLTHLNYYMWLHNPPSSQMGATKDQIELEHTQARVHRTEPNQIVSGVRQRRPVQLEADDEAIVPGMLARLVGMPNRRDD